MVLFDSLGKLVTDRRGGGLQRVMPATVGHRCEFVTVAASTGFLNSRSVTLVETPPACLRPSRALLAVGLLDCETIPQHGAPVSQMLFARGG